MNWKSAMASTERRVCYHVIPLICSCCMIHHVLLSLAAVQGVPKRRLEARILMNRLKVWALVRHLTGPQRQVRSSSVQKFVPELVWQDLTAYTRVLMASQVCPIDLPMLLPVNTAVQLWFAHNKGEC